MQARWSVLSPLLDELLELDEPARGRRLAVLRTDDAALADELQALLDELPEIERGAFLERPALMATPGLAGQTVGPYTVERELGEGGMGSVWLARRTDGRYEGLVAIKFLNAALMARGGAQRFAREGSILARLSHPNIARLLDAGVARDGAQPYLVLEYIDGQPIDRHCDEHRLDLQQRVLLFLDVLAAVAHAHNHLVLHRDLKPSNILVTAEGEVKLLDFGIAKLLDDAQAPGAATELTRQAGRAFTALYAAPEQLQGDDVTTATDVYALGVLLYQLLGGRHPTAEHSTTTTPLDQMRAVIEQEPKRLSDTVAHSPRHDAAKLARELRGDLDNIVAKALKKAPAQRYANAAEFADDLRRYLNHEPVAARPDGAAYRVGKFLRRHRVGVAAGALVAGALAAGLGVALWQAREAERQRVQAEGLIEFMLGDLRKKLQPVGRLDVLDAVGEKALAYYGAQDAADLDAEALGRKARALHLIGEIAERRNNLDEAARVFQQAADTTAALLARHPQNAQHLFEHAQSVYWVGYMERKRGRLEHAEDWFRRYLEITQRLVAQEPGKLDWRVENAYAQQNLGVVYLETSRFSQAMESFRRSHDIWTTVVKGKPELHYELAQTLGWVAKAQEALGDFEGAIGSQHAKSLALDNLPDAQSNRPAHQLRANANKEIGQLELAMGRYAKARHAAALALQQYEALAASDPTNMVWHAQMVFARAKLAEVLLSLNERDKARRLVDKAKQDAAPLLSKGQASKKWGITLGGVLLLTDLALADWPTERRTELERFVSRAKATGSTVRLDVEETQVLADAELMLGDMLARSSLDQEARARWKAVEAQWREPAERGEPAAMTRLAHARLRLGFESDARTLAQRVQASSYRHPAYADLVKRLTLAEGAARKQ